MLKIELYDDVLLKDGRTATVTEVFKTACVADIRIDDGDYDTQFVSFDEIEKVIKE